MAAETQNFTESHLLIGQVVNGLRIESVLGEGGMGAVFLARQPGLGLTRALKVIRAELHSNQEVEKRFRREAMAMSRLQHNNIVQILDLGTLDNGWPYLAMEFIAGTNVQQQIETQGPFSLLNTLLILQQLASALAYAHAQGIAHRDLKPENVVLRDGDPNQVKIIDFGLAKILSDEGMTQLTGAGQLLGSPLYMAPEQAGLGVTGAPADVYALAGVAYFLLSGHGAFRWSDYGCNAMQVIVGHCHDQPDGLGSRCPTLQVPPLLEALLLACLSKDAAKRPSADELVSHFTRLLQEQASLKPEQTTAETKNNSRLAMTSVSSSPPMRSLGNTLFGKEVERPQSDLLDAILTQLTAVMLDLAREWAVQTGARSAVAQHLSEVESKSDSIAQLELEQALLDSELAASAREDQTLLHPKLETLSSQIDHLRADSRRSLLRIFDLVNPLATTSMSPSVAQYSSEFQSLLVRYQETEVLEAL